MRADDALKYAAARLQQTSEWTTDTIAGSGCGGDHDDELDGIHVATDLIVELAEAQGSPLTYSDGRTVRTRKQIVDGLVTDHIWHPNPAAEEPHSWRGALSSGDPDLPSPGIYEVTTEPETQSIHVRVMRTA